MVFFSVAKNKSSKEHKILRPKRNISIKFTIIFSNLVNIKGFPLFNLKHQPLVG